MDFICLEAGCYPSVLHPSSPRMLLEPLEMEVTLSWDIHISSCHPLWLRERNAWAQKVCLSQGKWANPALLSPPTSPVPSHLQCFLPLASPPFWLSYPAAFHQPRPRSSLIPPQMPCKPSCPPWTAPFPGLPQPNFLFFSECHSSLLSLNSSLTCQVCF